MWESLARVNAVVGGVVWGPVGLALLFGTGCLLTVRTGFFQLLLNRSGHTVGTDNHRIPWGSFLRGTDYPHTHFLKMGHRMAVMDDGA